MSPSILIVGATGNTGVGVVNTIMDIASKTAFANHEIIALTRDTNGTSAKKLASAHPSLKMIAQDWTMIDAKWLEEHEVERLFIASHNGVSHFTDESLFLNAALRAGVKYVVRISTTVTNIGPDTKVFYARNHWAVETMLETPEFEAMQWSSLQPNGFISLVTPALTGWLENYRKTGKKDTLRLMVDDEHPIALIDSQEIGAVAAHLLVQEDTSKHNKRKYCLVGPTDFTGKEAVALLEKHAGTDVPEVVYRDTSFVDYAKSAGTPANVLESLRLAPASGYDGGASTKTTPTSPEVLELYKLHVGAMDEYEKALAAVPK